jgi:hypothetical protein
MGLKLPPEVEKKVLEQAGLSPAKPARPRPSPPAKPARVRLVVFIPGLLPRSEANAGGRRRDKIARKCAAKAAVAEALRGVPWLDWPRPVKVVLTRVGGKRMDSDNVARCFKSCRDQVATFLGVDDGDTTAVRFVTRQRAGYESGTEITIG